MVDIYINIMVGLLGIILGFVTIKYKLGYLVNWLDSRKYDNDKASSIAGSHVMLYGFVLIFLAGVNYLTLEYNVQNIITTTMLISAFAIILAIYYKINKYAKLDEQY